MRYFWGYDVINSNSRPRIGTRKINGGAKFSEIKVQKTRVVMFVIHWSLARYLGKTYCVRKCKKVDIENLIRGTLKGPKPFFVFVFCQAVEAAKMDTGEANETEAITQFRNKLDSSDNYFNDQAFPENESDSNAHELCSSIEAAKKYCPTRWKAIQSWFKEARMVDISCSLY